MAEPAKKCDHKIREYTAAEAAGGYDEKTGSIIIDVSCRFCGISGSLRVGPEDINWDEDDSAIVVDEPVSLRPTLTLRKSGNPNVEEYNVFVGAAEVGTMVVRNGVFRAKYDGDLVYSTDVEGSFHFADPRERELVLIAASNEVIDAHLKANIPTAEEHVVPFKVIP